MIAITLVGTTTVVTVTDPNANVVQKIALTGYVNFSLNGDTIVFHGQDEVINLAINFQNLSAGTLTALGNPANNSALMDALVSGGYFQGK